MSVRVTGRSSKTETVKRSIYDPAIDSNDTASGSDYRGLSFLEGSVGSNDMGADNNWPFAAPMLGSSESWEEKYRKQRNLRRHTVEQGSSTFSFPKDRDRGLANS